MAEILKGPGSKGGPVPKKKKKAAADKEVGPGHNLADIRKAAEPAFKRLLKIQSDFETEMGKFKADFKSEYDDSAEKIGIRPAVLKREFRRLVRNMKEEAEEQEMKETERDQIEMVREAMGDTPMGKYLEGKLAKSTALHAE